MSPVVRPFRAALLVLLAAGSFHLAFANSALSALVLVYLGCLFELRHLPTARQAFWVGFLVGAGVYVPQMGFLWSIFHLAAVPLWSILALFHGLTVLLFRGAQQRLGTRAAVVLAPVVWCGVEYLRSEWWWLRFSWFSVGSVFDGPPALLLRSVGVYGVGGVLMAVSAGFLGWAWPRWRRRALVGAVGFLLAWTAWSWGMAGRPVGSPPPLRSPIPVAGVQLEFPGLPEVLITLERLRQTHPEAELILLSEYTFDGPVPDRVKSWCQRHRKWLVAGGKAVIADPRPPSLRDRFLQRFGVSLAADSGSERFFNTAFVVSPQGEIVFSQAKSVPIQFFKDGEPASGQQVWDSPWGRVGIAICYDASYRRVMDGLIRQGAEVLLIPTMDVETWGAYEHGLNARMARVRALEYGMPLFRVASSGISQLIDARGVETATAPVPGLGELIAGRLEVRQVARGVPWDAFVAPTCTIASGGLALFLAVPASRRRRETGVPPTVTPPPVS